MNDPHDTSNWHEYRTLFGNPLTVTLTMWDGGTLDITNAVFLKDTQLHIDNDKVLAAMREHQPRTVGVGEGRTE